MKNDFELSTAFSMHNGVVVLEKEENHVTFGLLDEGNQELRERLSRCAIREKSTCSFEKISDEDFDYIVSRQYGSEEERDGVFDEKAVQDRENREESEKEKRAAVLLLDSLIAEARLQGATDIHIEENAVRFRLDGTLKTVCSLAREKSRQLISRVKALSNLEVMENRRAEDGSFVVEGKEPLFVRVSCIPVISASSEGRFGSQSCVLRLLDPARCPPEISALGFSNDVESALRKAVKKESGLILVCGPTGSGKTTTVSALLKLLQEESSASKKIITVEDPVEYILDGVSQLLLDEKSGLTFDSALSYLFRQDPDVLFIGEIRNRETCRAAINASLTGHLVFATLHTAGFEETELRLLQLGAEEKEIRFALKAVLCQRLSFEGGGASAQGEVKIYE